MAAFSFWESKTFPCKLVRTMLQFHYVVRTSTRAVKILPKAGNKSTGAFLIIENATGRSRQIPAGKWVTVGE